MTDAGLWNIAKSDPDAIAVVDALRGRLTYRKPAARAGAELLDYAHTYLAGREAKI
jgi:hypothetical protein